MAAYKSGEADLLFEQDFELYIKHLLEENGYKVFHSVYLKGEKYKCQIDLIAVKGYSIIGIECKSQFGSHWVVKRNSDWSYIDTKGNYQKIANPIRQSNNHNTALIYLCANVGLQVSEKYGRDIPDPFRKSIICCKAKISDSTMKDINACNYTKLVDYINEYYSFSKGEEIDSYMYSILFPILENCADSSKEALKQHVKYLKSEVLC